MAGVLGREETHARDEGDRDWSPVAASQERDTKDGPQTPEAAGGKEAPPPPPQIRGSTAPLTPWLWTSGLQTRGEVPFCCCKPPSLWCFVTAALGNEYKVIGMSAGHWSLAWKAHPGLTPIPALLSVLQGWTRSPPVPSGSSSLRRPFQVCVSEPRKSSHGTSPHPGTPAAGGEGGLHPAAPSSSLTPSCPCPVSSQTPPGLSCGKL